MHTFSTILEAAEKEKGMCLSCGKIQPFLQYRMPFSPCTSCGHWNVLHAKAVVRVFSLVSPSTLPPIGRALEAPNDPAPPPGKTLT